MIVAIAGGIGFVVFLLLMAALGLSLSPAILLAIIAALIVALFFLRGGADVPVAQTQADVAPESGTALAGLNAESLETPDGPVVRDTAAEEAPDAGQPETPRIKPSKPLAGQAELAERKGTWKYERGGAPAGAATGAGAGGSGAAMGVDADAPSPDGARGADDRSAEEILSPEPSAPPDIDHDAIPANGRTSIEGEPVIGTEPARLDGPRADGADDLTRIKGVGPKLEAMLNEMGFYHYDQIANWSGREVAWVDSNLEGFKGRVTRDDWVPQARILAEGGETDFSKRADE